MNTYLLCIEVVRHHHHTPKKDFHTCHFFGAVIVKVGLFFFIPLSVCAIGIRLSQSLDTFVSLIHSEKKKNVVFGFGRGWEGVF